MAGELVADLGRAMGRAHHHRQAGHQLARQQEQLETGQPRHAVSGDEHPGRPGADAPQRPLRVGGALELEVRPLRRELPAERVDIAVDHEHQGLHDVVIAARGGVLAVADAGNNRVSLWRLVD